MVNKRELYTGGVITLSGVLIMVYGFINLLNYLFGVIEALFLASDTGRSFEKCFNKIIEENMITFSFFGMFIIFIIGVILVTAGVDKMGSYHDVNDNYYINNRQAEQYQVENINQNVEVTHMWRCSVCGNMINTEPCPYCYPSQQQMQAAGQYTAENGWRCSCGHHNNESAKFCGVCGKTK